MSKKKPELATIKTLEVKNFKDLPDAKSIKIKVKVAADPMWAINPSEQFESDLAAAVLRVTKKHIKHI